MLWIALALPRLPLDVFARAISSTEAAQAPQAAVDARQVLAVDDRAARRGVRPGQSLAAAYALVPELITRRREPARERDALAAAATWAYQFTPNVALHGEAGLLIEVSGSLKLFSGLAAIVAGLRSGMADLGLACVLASAPTARGAWWLLRAGYSAPIDTQEKLAATLATLPIEVIDCPPRTLDMLNAIGARTLGAVIALPRAGFARRFGSNLLDQLDEALGRRNVAVQWFIPPEHFDVKLELPALVDQADALIFGFQRLFTQLEGFLRARASGVQQLALVMHHDDKVPSTLTLGMVAPAYAAAHFTALARERLGRFALPAQVHTIVLRAEQCLPLAASMLSLFDDTSANTAPADWAKLIERLSARLGHDAVQGITLMPEHRPEQASRLVSLSAAYNSEKTAPRAPFALTPRSGSRPLWLVNPPRRLLERQAQPYDDGPLALLVGPERIESGWWDGGDIARDYFIAARADHSLVWIYRERPRSATDHGQWYLHGLFA